MTGFGVLSWPELRFGAEPQLLSYGILELSGNENFNHRLGVLLKKFAQVLEEFLPQAVAIEEIFLGKNTQSAFKLGHARGVIIAACSLRSIPVFEYATRSIKKGLTGQGGAEKIQVQQVLKLFLKIQEDFPLDASDALATAYHHGVQETQKRMGL